MTAMQTETYKGHLEQQWPTQIGGHHRDDMGNFHTAETATFWMRQEATCCIIKVKIIVGGST